ncbi:hypothetical protein EJB05_49166 [Eragrostis curvula]|uniref:Uncharacterized protein n=1 Tax=Eragrostis curvula TaxID=38414 RepID=A0A5J9T3I4_9POAL|nr:hypothetical protein EJB05_49166 [Eragrostis curvula]
MAPAYCPKSPAAFPAAASGLERSTALAIFSGSPASTLPLRKLTRRVAESPSDSRRDRDGQCLGRKIREATTLSRNLYGCIINYSLATHPYCSTINHALAWDSEKLGFSGRLPHPIVQGSRKCEVLDVTLSGIASESNLEAVT